MVELQQRSAQMSQQLSNRQAVRATLSQFIDDMTVSEDLISYVSLNYFPPNLKSFFPITRCILETPVTEQEFAIRLSELGHKMSFVKEQSFRESRSVIDVREALEHLRVKAVTKVRAFLLEQVYKLRKPMANYQVPQNNLLSKYKYQL
jgi:vacuolar protein sorting-associated protein 52